MAMSKSNFSDTVEVYADSDSTVADPPLPTYRLPRDRSTQKQGGVRLPANTVVVSPDDHFSIKKDIWFAGVPDRLKDKAPRVWQANGVFHIGFAGKSLFNEALEKALGSYDAMPGNSEIAPRMQQLDIEGIDKELVFGNGALGLLGYPDLEMREWIYRLYNEHLTKLGEEAPGRFFGVGLMKYWDPANAREAVAEVKALGMKTFMLPLKPGKDKDGVDINYASEKMEPLWNAIQDSGLPVCFHIGEHVAGGRGGTSTSFLVQLNPFRNVIGELIFGGVLDRHPGIKVAFIEAGLNWITGLLQDCDTIAKSFGPVADWKIRHSPRYYWNKHCFASFMTDPIGLGQLDMIGRNHIMWTADYPHAESTFGYSWSAMQAVLDVTSDDEARQILGGTALKLFNL